jgi:hypothetical protein
LSEFSRDVLTERLQVTTKSHNDAFGPWNMNGVQREILLLFLAGNYLSGAHVDGSLEQLLSTSDQLCPQVSRILV